MAARRVRLGAELPGTLLLVGDLPRAANCDAAAGPRDLLRRIRAHDSAVRLRLVTTPPPGVGALAGRASSSRRAPRPWSPHLDDAAVVLAPHRTGGMRIRVLHAVAARARAYAHRSPRAWSARLEAVYEDARAARP